MVTYSTLSISISESVSQKWWKNVIILQWLVESKELLSSSDAPCGITRWKLVL